MKKTMTIILVLLLGVSMLAGCGGKNAAPGAESEQPAEAPAQTEALPEPTPEPTPEPEPEDVTEPEPEPVADLTNAFAFGSGPNTFVFEDVTFSFTLPDGDWSARQRKDGEPDYFLIYNLPPQDEYKDKDPRILIHFSNGYVVEHGSHEDRIDNKTIAGIDMTGATVGSSLFVEEHDSYIGIIDDVYSIYIAIQHIDYESGEGKAVLDSFQFKVK